MGATEDCRLGEEPIFVLYGDRPKGGGNTVFEDLRRRRVDSTSVTSGTELCARSISDEVSVVLPLTRFGGLF